MGLGIQWSGTMATVVDYGKFTRSGKELGDLIMALDNFISNNDVFPDVVTFSTKQIALDDGDGLWNDIYEIVMDVYYERL